MTTRMNQAPRPSSTSRCASSRRWRWARLLGWFAGSVWAGISGALALYLALESLATARAGISGCSIAASPIRRDAMGLWGDVVAQVVRLHRRKRFHKERLTRLFRELRRSTAAMPDGVVMLDPHGEIVWFNRKAGEMLDLSRRADLGLRIDNLVRHPDFVRYLRGGQYSLPLIVRIDTPTERHLAFQLISYGEDQRLLMLRDVTREVRLEQMRKDFVANASHELRSPLTVVAGYLETFGGDPNLGELAAPIAEMRRQTDRMTRIIEDLLELSRFEANEAPIKGQPIDVAAMAAMLRKDVLARPTHPRQVEMSIESTASLHRRRGHGAVRVLEPGRQCRQVHAARRQHADPLVDGRRGRPLLGARHRAGHSRRAHSAAHRTFLPRRPGPLARDRRLGARPGHRQARIAPPWRQPGHREHRGPRQHVHLSFSAGTRARAARGGERLGALPRPVMCTSLVTNKLHFGAMRRIA